MGPSVAAPGIHLAQDSGGHGPVPHGYVRTVLAPCGTQQRREWVGMDLEMTRTARGPPCGRAEE